MGDILDFEDLLELEDIFEIVTPGGVDSRVLALDVAWISLVADNKNNSYVISEYNKWNQWKTQVLNYSFLTKTWANGILNELDDWHKRYDIAFMKADNKSSSPDPIVFDGNKPNELTSNPWFWVAVATIGTVAALALYYKLSK